MTRQITLYDADLRDGMVRLNGDAVFIISHSILIQEGFDSFNEPLRSVFNGRSGRYI